MDCLPILGMIYGCNTLDIAMLRWITYIKLLNPEIGHAPGRHNVIADMLSWARYEGDEDRNSNEEEVGLDFFTSSYVQVLATFKEENYNLEFVEIGKYLSSLQRDEAWSMEDFHRIRKKVYKYFLKEGALWMHGKKKNGIPMRVVCKLGEKQNLISEFDDNVWAGHRGIWAMFAKLKNKYWWQGI